MSLFWPVFQLFIDFTLIGYLLAILIRSYKKMLAQLDATSLMVTAFLTVIIGIFVSIFTIVILQVIKHLPAAYNALP